MFDERQRLLRLRGFAGGFWLLLGLLGLNFAVSAVVGHPVVADQGTLTMLVFFSDHGGGDHLRHLHWRVFEA
ncbi:hypothetical protein [Lacticaseibacillus camelliae]|uniref:hypothetical protein n=1 Tax=Lacticaseibacillus camelliae TaxID=381742 RepID=UPI0006D01785|nr:hypothetical protein [Lacticaseibacillus camelliae]